LQGLSSFSADVCASLKIVVSPVRVRVSPFRAPGWLVFRSIEVLDFSGWPVVEVFVDALVVESGDVLDDGELEL